MPGFPLTIGTLMSCFHRAPAKIPTTPKPVTILGQPVLTPAGQIGVVLCPFPPGGPPSPCLTIRWPMVSTKVTVQTQPLLIMPLPNKGPGPGICVAAAPQGAANMTANQAKVFVA